MNDGLDFFLEDPSPLLGEVGTANVVRVLREVRATSLDPFDAVERARFALRALGAALNPYQADPLTIARIAGYLEVPAMPFCAALSGTGLWGGEMGVEKLRAFLTMVLQGQHPQELADQIGLDEAEWQALNELLGLVAHWQDTHRDRVLLAVMDGASLRDIRRITRCSRVEARRWRAWAQEAMAEFDTGLADWLQQMRRN